MKFGGRLLDVELVLSLPARGVWIEIITKWHSLTRLGSLPARGVWIEITFPMRAIIRHAVALRKGSVD